MQIHENLLVFASFLPGRGLLIVEFKVKNGVFALRRTSHVDSEAETLIF